MSSEVRPKRFTTDEYDRMGESGILPSESRFELIRGEIIEMPSPLPPHSGTVNRLTQAFQLRLAKSAIVSIQNPVHLGAWSAPQPDLCVLRPRPDFYTRSHPTPEDIFLIIEVSHTTIRYDAEVKAGLYAEAGIAEYWQIDIPSRKVIVRTGPARGAYRQQAEYGPDPIVVPGAFPEIHFPVAELLG